MVADIQRTFGQFDTPADVADLLLGFCLRRPSDRLLDPSCGTGAFLKRAAKYQQWLADGRLDDKRLWGVELDPAAAVLAQSAVPEAEISQNNFFALAPDPMRLFDAIIGNPPYTRAEWINTMTDGRPQAKQMSIFGNEVITAPNEGKGEDATADSGQKGILNRRAGLHAHFFIHGTRFLREGGRFGFVVPNSWLDVAYGERLKQFLLDHFKIVALIESNVERWFEQAKVNTCLVVLERCSDAEYRAQNLVRLARLRRPLAELVTYNDQDDRRWTQIERLTTRLLPGNSLETEDIAVRVVPQKLLAPKEKWGVALRAPLVYWQGKQQVISRPMGKWADVQRGYTTGANGFFYLDDQTIETWAIEPHFCRPLLKSLRQVHGRWVTTADCDQYVLDISPTAELEGTGAAAYLAFGESQGIHKRRTCAGRQPWYGLPEQRLPNLVLAKGIWQRHFAVVVSGDLRLDQQLYQVRLADSIPLSAAAALLNSAWFALQLELNGRVNFGEGVLWLAAYELVAVRLPDLRYLPDNELDELGKLFEALQDRPVTEIEQTLQLPEQKALDGFVFNLLGLSEEEGTAVVEGLLERTQVRLTKAAAVSKQ
ncbi:MAG: N-6 DNA methylase [Candidatus Promineifilaceae bacterium]